MQVLDGVWGGKWIFHEARSSRIGRLYMVESLKTGYTTLMSKTSFLPVPN